MERAQPDVGATDPLELDVGQDDVDQRDALTDPLDVLVDDPHCSHRHYRRGARSWKGAAARRRVGGS